MRGQTIFTIVLIVICIVSIAFSIIPKITGNRELIDFTYDFDYAYIELPGGEVVKGNVSSWRDYEDGDQLQVTINGKTYLTDTTRCVLVKNK